MTKYIVGGCLILAALFAVAGLGATNIAVGFFWLAVIAAILTPPVALLYVMRSRHTSPGAKRAAAIGLGLFGAVAGAFVRGATTHGGSGGSMSGIKMHGRED